MGTAFLNNWFLCLSFASYSHCSHPQEPLLIPTTDWEHARSLGTEVDLQVLRQAGNTRALHIKKLRNLADEIDLLYQTFNKEKIKGNGASLLGGGTAVVSGILTLVTGGLAIPALGTIGFVTGIAGGVWNILGSNEKEKKEQEIKAMIQKVIEDDNNLQEDVRTEMNKFEMLDHTQKYIWGEALLAVAKGWGAITLNYGPIVAGDLLLGCLSPDAMLYCSEIEMCKPLIEAAAKTTPSLFGTRGTKAESDKLVGGITLGLGVISCAWDTYQISIALDGSKEGAKTKLGIALRRIASQLEKQMLNRSGG